MSKGSCHVPYSRSTRTKVFKKECYESRAELSGYGNVMRNAVAECKRCTISFHVECFSATPKQSWYERNTN